MGDKDQIDIKVHENKKDNDNDDKNNGPFISIEAERKNKLGDVYKINRQFHLDPKTADVEKIDANVADGVLEVTVQKKKIVVPDSNGPRRIEITTTSLPTNDQNDDVNVEKKQKQ